MKKIYRIHLAVIAVLVMTFTSCSSDAKLGSGIGNESTNTYVGLSVFLPSENGSVTRAGGNALSDTNNPDQEWGGRDVIESVDIYMISKDKNLVARTSYKNRLSIDEDGRIWPVITAKSYSGAEVGAFIVINDKNSKLTSKLDLLNTADKFMASFNEEVAALASDIATTNADEKDVIVMTNTLTPNSAEITVKANVSENQARNGENKIAVKVERITARGLVTVAQPTLANIIAVQNGRGEDVSEILIEEVQYGVGQSNTAVFPVKKADFLTPNYNTKTSVTLADLLGKFDNSGLKKMSNLPFIESKDKVRDALSSETTDAKYVLPLVHQNYFKGNTIFFEVRAKFEVKGSLADTGQPQEADQDVLYLGADDGKFYADRLFALGKGDKLTPEQVEAGDFKQKVYTYLNNSMIYVLWLNPKNAKDPAKSFEAPVVRNQVYHAHITKFKEMGLPYNPLNPEDPATPTDPTDPTEPVNPIDPTDPNEKDETFLSVDISVVPWGVNSSDVEVGNDY